MTLILIKGIVYNIAESVGIVSVYSKPISLLQNFSLSKWDRDIFIFERIKSITALSYTLLALLHCDLNFISKTVIYHFVNEFIFVK